MKKITSFYNHIKGMFDFKLDKLDKFMTRLLMIILIIAVSIATYTHIADYKAKHSYEKPKVVPLKERSYEIYTTYDILYMTAIGNGKLMVQSENYYPDTLIVGNLNTCLRFIEAVSPINNPFIKKNKRN